MDSETERKYTRSVSQLKSWAQCGEKFYLERIQRRRMPKRPAPWTLMGIAVHDSIMEWEETKHELDIIAYYYRLYDELAEEAWRDQPDPLYWFLPPNAKYVDKAIKTYRERGAEQLRVYIDAFESRPWEILCLEREFEIDLGGVLVKGTVDRVLYFVDEDWYLVEDLKTGTVKDEADHRQLGFYAFVARELWELPVRDGRYWYLKANRPSETYDLSRFDREFWTDQFARLDTAIHLGIYLPNPGSHCQLCPVRPWCSTQGWLEIGEPL